MSYFKEKALMTYFFAGNAVDLAITHLAVNQNPTTEVNPLAAELFKAGNAEVVDAVKIGVTTILIGVYALAAKEGSVYKFSADTLMKIGSIAIWGAVALNTIEVLKQVNFLH